MDFYAINVNRLSAIATEHYLNQFLPNCDAVFIGKIRVK